MDKEELKNITNEELIEIIAKLKTELKEALTIKEYYANDRDRLNAKLNAIKTITTL